MLHCASVSRQVRVLLVVRIVNEITLLIGVAYLHEGVNEADSKIVSSLFESGAVQVLASAPGAKSIMKCPRFAGDSRLAVNVLCAAYTRVFGRNHGHAILQRQTARVRGCTYH